MQNAVFGPMFLDQPFQCLFSSGGQFNENLPPIHDPGPSSDQTELLSSINEFHDAVVAPLKLLSQFAHRGKISLGEPFDGKEELILLRRDALPANCLLTVTQKAS